MALTEAQVLANELEAVDKRVPALFDRDATFFADVEKRPVEKVSNRDMRVPLELRPGGRFGHFDPDGGDMGRGDGPSFDKALVPTVHLKHAIEWTKKAEWATDDGRKAVVNTLKHLIAKAMPEFRRNVDSLCMTGGDGVLGTVGTFTANFGGSGKDRLFLTSDGFGARLLRYGQFINIYSSTLAARRVITTLGTVNGEGPIDYIDLPNKTVQINAATAALANGDKIVVSGLTATPPVSLLGVPYHHNDASTGSWLSLDRVTIPEIRANRVNASSASLALPFPRLALNKIADRVGIDFDTKVTAWLHVCQKQAYEELGQLVSVIQKSPRQEGLDLYFNDNMQLAGAPTKPSMSWDKTRIDFIMKSVWGRAEMHPAGMYTVDGRKIFEVRGSSGGIATAQLFYITASFNLFVNNPAACAYISNLAVPSGY
jgi:hypothetical protein